VISLAVACALYVSDICITELADDKLKGDHIILTGVI